MSRLVVERLHSGGFEVMWISEALSGIPDTIVLHTAEADGRILITEDRDFGELAIRQRLFVTGVIVLELDRLSAAAEASRVFEFIASHGGKIADNLIVLEPSRIRIRPLQS